MVLFIEKNLYLCTNLVKNDSIVIIISIYYSALINTIKNKEI